MTYLFCNCKFLPIDSFHPFAPSPPLTWLFKVSWDQLGHHYGVAAFGWRVEIRISWFTEMTGVKGWSITHSKFTSTYNLRIWTYLKTGSSQMQLVNEKSCQIRMNPKSKNWCFYKRKERESQKHRGDTHRKEHYMKREAKIEMTCIMAKECRGLLVTSII